jgi:methyltransferase (TIGR00027 family)
MSTFSTNGDIGATAVVVAKFRAIETTRADRLFSDPLAEVLVAEAGMAETDGITLHAIEAIPMLRRVYDATVCRTRFLVEHVLSAIEDGCTQIVLLAAGLDTRAYRLPVGDQVTFYELDFARMLDFKDDALERRGVRPLTTRIGVAADLTADWGDRLLAAGFDPSVQTIWMAEGILMYFTQEQNNALLNAISKLSSARSRFLFVANGPGWLADGASKDLKAVVEQAGVAFKSYVEDPDSWLSSAGWDVRTVETLDSFGAQLGRIAKVATGQPARSWAVDAVKG